MHPVAEEADLHSPRGRQDKEDHVDSGRRRWKERKAGEKVQYV